MLKKFISHDYYTGIKALMLVIFAFFVLYNSFFVFFFVLIALAYFIITSKWRKPRVFISYKNAEAEAKLNTNEIALTIKAGLEKRGFKILFFKYNTELNHDHINFQIQKLLRLAHAMIVIPDPYKPSYVNSEISCAVISYKPVYIIKHTKDQKLPDTANSGHTVLLLDKLKQEKFKPLSYMLQYTHRVWHKRLFIIGMPLAALLYPFSYFVDAGGNFFIAVLIFALLTAALVYFNAPVLVVLLLVKIIIVLSGFFSAYATLKAIFDNLQLEKVVRQSMVNAGDTYSYFAEAGFDKEILECIDKAGFKK